jgi:hypothetical protein
MIQLTRPVMLNKSTLNNSASGFDCCSFIACYFSKMSKASIMYKSTLGPQQNTHRQNGYSSLVSVDLPLLRFTKYMYAHLESVLGRGGGEVGGDKSGRHKMRVSQWEACSKMHVLASWPSGRAYTYGGREKVVKRVSLALSSRIEIFVSYGGKTGMLLIESGSQLQCCVSNMMYNYL